MISPYIRPQDTITQILQQTPAREASRRNPIVIGPQYDLYINDGRDLDAAKRTFDAAGETALIYVDENGLAINLTNRTPATSEAQLYGEGLQADVANFGAGLWDIDSDDTTWRSIRIGTNLIAGVGTLNTALDGRQIRIGDVIESDWNDGSGGTGTTRRTVVGLLGEVTPAVIPANATDTGPFFPTTNGADLIEPVTADAVWVIFDLNVGGSLVDFQAHGYVQEDVGGDLKLGDQITVTVNTPGASGTATFDVTSLATGLTATNVLSVNPGGGEYEIDLSGVGYSAGPGTIELDHSGVAAAGETATVNIFPAHAPPATTLFTNGGTYTPLVDRRYAVEFVTGGSPGTNDVRIYDVAGDDPPISIANADDSATDHPLGTSGATVQIGGASFAKGYIYYIDITAKQVSNIAFDGVVLDGPAVPAQTMIDFPATTFDANNVFQVYTGVIDDSNTSGGLGTALTAGAADWAYAAGLGLDQDDVGRDSVSHNAFADGYGEIFLSYKALVVPGATESVIEIDLTTEVTEKLGETSLENWLARGALEAFRGNQNRIVYALRTNGDSVAAFTDALRKIQTTDNVYALVGLTDRQDVMELIRDHCNDMSNKFNKNFRRAYVGTDSPGEWTWWGQLPGGGYRQGDLASSVVTLDAAYRAASKFTSDDVGSTITVQSIGLTFEILEVLSDYEVLTDANVGLTATSSNLTVTRPDTPASQALFVRSRSQSLSSRRIANVWCDNATVVENSLSTVIPNKFIAAEIAGLRCALLPQQGLTLTEIESADSAPSMYTLFDPDVLDDVSADGTFVVTQESEGGEVFIRHQLTTETEEGALAYEDNVGVIVDEFSYALKDEFRQYIGRRNATPDTIAEIDDRLKSIASDFTEVALVNQRIGPPILAFFDEKGNEGEVTVRQDGDLADTLLTYVKLRVPLPLNGINHYVDVEVAELLASEDNI